jgi:chromosome partitioning protein
LKIILWPYNRHIQPKGCCKTTSCLSLEPAWPAWAAHAGCGSGPQAHLNLAGGLKAEDLPHGSSLLDGSGPPQTYPTRDSGLEILPADLRLARLERDLYGRPEYERCLAQVLQPWQAYDFILLDCPPSMGALTVMALSAAHRALIPVQCDYFSSQGVIQLLEIIEAVKDHTNPSLAYFIFVTLFDRRNLVSRTVLEQPHSLSGEPAGNGHRSRHTPGRDCQASRSPSTLQTRQPAVPQPCR